MYPSVGKDVRPHFPCHPGALFHVPPFSMWPRHDPSVRNGPGGTGTQCDITVPSEPQKMAEHTVATRRTSVYSLFCGSYRIDDCPPDRSLEKPRTLDILEINHVYQ